MTEIDLLSFSMRDKPPAAGADWFKIVEAKDSKPTRVYIYDEIGYWGTSAKDFVALLAEIEGDIDLHLNTPGGSVFDGLAISAAIKAHDGKVIGKVDGMAASAGSFILQACEEREISRNASVMIHDAKAYAGGTAAQMRAAADLLDRVSNNIADIYAVRSGQGTEASWREIMQSGDKWYNGNEALEAGLVDTVVDNPEEDEDEPEEASQNSWTTAEVEAFLSTPPEKLAASAKHVTITNRVEEAHMTGTAPNTQQATTPPAVQQPPAAAATAPVVQNPAPAPAPQAQFPEALSGFVVNNTLDVEKVAAHVAGLETFKKETIESGRKDFVAKLAKEGKILANEETVKKTEDFALALSSELFTAWKESMDSAPVNPLFAQHGATGGQTPPSNGGSPDEKQQEIASLEEIIQGHRDAGVSQEDLEKKASWKRLQELKQS